MKKSELRQMIKEEILSEKKDYKYYQDLLWTVKEELNELAALGEDYSIFQAAKFAAKTLKKAAKDVGKVH